MHAHEFFADLLIHDDDELAALLGGEIVARELRHEWPLSRLEDVRLRDGRRYAYKAQLPPTVEPEFYAAAHSPLLVPFLDLGREDRTRFLATEWIEAPSLGSAELSDDEFLGHARRVTAAIGAIEGATPVFLDLSSAAALQEVADETAERLAALVGRGVYLEIGSDAPERVSSWARRPGVIRAVEDGSGISHGDLSPDEVLVVGDGYRVIDWQRPVLGPPEMDLVSLLKHRGLDPAAHLDREFVQLSWFLLLHWAALAQHDLLPGLSPRFTEGWALSALGPILEEG